MRVKKFIKSSCLKYTMIYDETNSQTKLNKQMIYILSAWTIPISQLTACKHEWKFKHFKFIKNKM